MAYSI